MHVAVRLHTKAGICAASAAAVALSPLLPSVPAAPHLPAISTAAVRLTADFNPLQPWMDVFNTASVNAQKIGSSFAAAPAVLLQQILANQVSHLGAILQNPGSIGTVLGQVVKNVQSVVQAATLLNTNYNTDQAFGSLDGWHYMALQMTPKLLPTANDPQATQVITQVLNVLASPLSGVLIGLAGPAISPVVALVNTLTAAGAALSAGDAMAALQHLINIPANVVGGFLNGANLNLGALVPLINGAGLLTNDTTLHDLSIQFGGLLTAGTTGSDPVTGASNGIGGSILNSLGQVVTTGIMGFPLDLPIDGQGVGPIGALVSLGQLLAKAIGWSGTGNPLAPAATTAPAPAAATNELAVSVTKSATDNSATSIPQVTSATAATKATATATPAAATPATATPAAAAETPASSRAAAASTESSTTTTDATKPAATGAGAESTGTTTKSDSTKTDSPKTDSPKSSSTTKSDSTKTDGPKTTSTTKSDGDKSSSANKSEPQKSTTQKSGAEAKSTASQGASAHSAGDSGSHE
ncbi:MAG: outer membrane porin GjpA [Mycobacterium sp.]|nr:outer membrane porin GjpA [Mycobacterium sp.]